MHRLPDANDGPGAAAVLRQHCAERYEAGRPVRRAAVRPASLLPARNIFVQLRNNALVRRYEKLGAVNLAAAAKGRGRTKMYRVDQPARLRNGFELDSELVGRLEPGDVLRVLEERQNVNGPPNGTALCCRHTADSGEFWHQG